jgi:Uma2 family endonuclease
MTTTTIRRFSVYEYHRMAEVGIIHPEERVELIEGQIIQMAAKNPPHSATTKCASDYLRNLMSGLADIRVQEPIQLNKYSEPEPDIAVVQMHPRNYFDRHPQPNEVFLVIEVSDTTLKFDREVKAAAYASAAIADYWILDANKQQVFVFRNPHSGTYEQQSILPLEETISPLACPEINILIARLFP